MTFSLENAQIYDVEAFPNCFTLSAEPLNGDQCSTWEISDFRDDRLYLFQWFEWLRQTQTPMIGFNNVFYDYRIIHFLMQNPNATAQDIYGENQRLFASQDRFGGQIWERDRFAPQIDLFKVNHFDNKAKTTSLKALQINMRSRTVLESRVPFGTVLTRQQIEQDIIPYNVHDVKETKKFALHCKSAIDFRIGLMDQFGIEVLNYNDTKIGEKMLEKRLGDDVCYRIVPRFPGDNYGKREKRQTYRREIPLRDIIFPYVRFDNPEFQRVLNYMQQQVLTPDDLDDPEAEIKTKGVFKNLSCMVGGVSFEFGTGGIHASVSQKRFMAGNGYIIRDIDVASLYPSVAIVNSLAPAHLGEVFTAAYAELPIERKRWQKEKGKKCVEANSIKLAANGAYGKSNSKFSVLYDPQFTMTITINGQLMLCMLAEKLVNVPTLQIIQVNTDGITYMIHESYVPQAQQIEADWQALTLLTLEDAQYSRMWIADVNTYIAEGLDGKLKQKGRLWHPDSLDYATSISECQPPAWHKDFNPTIVPRAAVAAMVHNVPPEQFIRAHTDPFDFMCRVKVDRASRLELDGRQVQSTTRYYVSHAGGNMVKISPPPADARPGAYKRKNGVTLAHYNAVMEASGWQWNAEVCTGNKSIYEDRRTNIEAGWKVKDCNDADAFDFGDLNYEFYIAEARKLIIS